EERPARRGRLAYRAQYVRTRVVLEGHARSAEVFEDRARGPRLPVGAEGPAAHRVGMALEEEVELRLEPETGARPGRGGEKGPQPLVEPGTVRQAGQGLLRGIGRPERIDGPSF